MNPKSNLLHFKALAGNEQWIRIDEVLFMVEMHHESNGELYMRIALRNGLVADTKWETGLQMLKQWESFLNRKK